ncbi:MAG: TetR/AcrR family transcriptional regulator [Desulfobacteraceae bacterium]|nr:TetR/AcrR family transcriptional regulator [Desulfobacteraceae bacterium]
MVTRQREKSELTKNELMKAAVKTFGEMGFEAATISEITCEAGYAKGNFYRYWSSKGDVFLDIMKQKLKQHRDKRDQRLADARDYDEALEIVIDFLCSFLDDSKWANIFLEFTVHAAKTRDLREKLLNGVYRLSADIYAEIFEPFTEKREEMKKMGAVVTALFEGFLIQHQLGDKNFTASDLSEIIRVLADYYNS